MADLAEVRAWARENGHDVSDRGAIPARVQHAYDAAHDPHDDTAGVSEADFYVAAAPPPSEPDDAIEGKPVPPPRKRERAPRKVTGKAAGRKSWRAMWGTAKSRATAKPRNRVDLSEFAADLWGDLAMITAGMPPVSRVLTVQAPYAGVAFDEAVRGVPLLDTVLQPVARCSASLRALNGLAGPPVMVASIVMDGEAGWQHDQSGRLKLDADKNPLPTQRTAMKLGMLQYSLMQMARTADMERVAERAAEDQARMAGVRQLIDFIFGFNPAGSGAAQQAPQDGGPVPQHAQPFTYPSAPAMDDVGAAAQ